MKKGLRPPLSPAPPANNLCPKCGSHLIKYVEREEVESKGTKTIERENVWYKCDKCEIKIGLDEAKDPHKVKKRLQLSAKGFLTDVDIKRIRKKLGLNQKEMDEKLGVGEKTFTRYENLSVRQSRAMDNLLRILDEYPEAIKVLKGRSVDRGKG